MTSLELLAFFVAFVHMCSRSSPAKLWPTCGRRVNENLLSAWPETPCPRRSIRVIGWLSHRPLADYEAAGFEVLSRRWVVERTFAWLGRCRRLVKDLETTIASAVVWVLVAYIRALTRRLARP